VFFADIPSPGSSGNADVPHVIPVILCGNVWLIYTLDHLLDARTKREKSARPAYRWHWENRRFLWPMLPAAGLGIAMLSLFFLPARILVF
jgi:hypothetical protein